MTASNSFTLKELAERFSLESRGEPKTRVTRLATLKNAGPDALGFFANSSYKTALASCRAGIVILRADDLEIYSGTCLISCDPYLSYAKIAQLFNEDNKTAQKHPGAHIDSTAVIHESVSIGAGAVVEAGVTIGSECEIGANVTLCQGVQIGQRVIIHPGAVIGADGFGLAFDQDHWIKVPQMGTVRIGDDCEIGANTTIDRGALEDTVLEEDVRLDNLVQVAHNVRIGAHTAIAGCVGIAGSTSIGKYCMIAGASGIGGHITIADKVTITAMSMVTRSITEAGSYGSGVEAQAHSEWRKNLARLRKLDKTINKLRG